jgi:TonB family protein
MEPEAYVMRRWLPIAFLAICASALPVFHPVLLAQQEQPASKRKMVTQATPMYPALARSMKIAGTVRVEAVVAPNGVVKSTEVIGGHPVLAQSALDAVKRCKWEPASHETKEIVILNFHPN